MKAYKYHRYAYRGQISLQSMNLSETITYIPELKRVLYHGYDGMGMKDYFGVLPENSDNEKRIIKEAEEYISDVKSGAVKNQLPDEEAKELPYAMNPGNYLYAFVSSLASQQKFYIKKIDNTPKKEQLIPPAGSSVSFIDSQRDIFYLSSYEEVELDITLEDVQKVEKNEQMIKNIQAAIAESKSKFFK